MYYVFSVVFDYTQIHNPHSPSLYLWITVSFLWISSVSHLSFSFVPLVFLKSDDLWLPICICKCTLWLQVADLLSLFFQTYTHADLLLCWQG